MEKVSMTLVGFDEYRDIRVIRDAAGKAVDSYPVKESHQVFLRLQVSGAGILQALISQSDFVTHILPTQDLPKGQGGA